MNLFRPFQIYLEWRAKRDETLARQFEQIDADARAHGMQLAEVVEIRAYYPKKGTKAWMVSLDTGLRTSVWIDHQQLFKRQIIAVSGHPGWGRHHDEDVFFIEHGSHYLISRRIYDGWRRHHARLMRAAKRVQT